MADNSWLQVLVNLPPEQPCSIVWRRACPGAVAAYEGGMDLSSSPGTPVYALADGFVLGAGYFWHPSGSPDGGNPGYGVVTTRITNSDGTQTDLYYQHIMIANNIVLCNQDGSPLYNGIKGPPPTFQPIKKNQLLGTVSVAGEVEVGLNANWGGVWGDSPHPGAWALDPEPYIRQLMAQGGGIGNGIAQFQTGNQQIDSVLNTAHSTANNAIQTLTNIQGLEGAIQVFDNAQQFQPFQVPSDNSQASQWPVIGGVEQGASYPIRVMLGVINFILTNFMAFVIRGVATMFCVIVIIALVINITSNTNEESADELGLGGMVPGGQSGNGFPVSEGASAEDLAVMA